MMIMMMLPVFSALRMETGTVNDLFVVDRPPRQHFGGRIICNCGFSVTITVFNFLPGSISDLLSIE